MSSDTLAEGYNAAEAKPLLMPEPQQAPPASQSSWPFQRFFRYAYPEFSDPLSTCMCASVAGASHHGHLQ